MRMTEPLDLEAIEAECMDYEISSWAAEDAWRDGRQHQAALLAEVRRLRDYAAGVNVDLQMRGNERHLEREGAAIQRELLLAEVRRLREELDELRPIVDAVAQTARTTAGLTIASCNLPRAIVLKARALKEARPS